jgi:enoyl-CoA hydratase/carnithine racemase
MACDLRIGGASARFGTGFAGVGYSGDFGGSWSLTRLVGTAKARELYFLGDIIDAAAAASLGLVNRVVADEAAEARDRRPRPPHRRRAAQGPRPRNRWFADSPLERTLRENSPFSVKKAHFRSSEHFCTKPILEWRSSYFR